MGQARGPHVNANVWSQMMRRSYSRRDFLRMSALSVGALALPSVVRGQTKTTRPNVVLIFLDDSGWADFQPFGSPAYRTPNVQRLAQEGCRFNNFYVPQAICSASRAALMTGCYPGRTKVFGAHPPRARGLDPKFATMGEVLKKAGYATAVFGKWHLGDQPETRPPARGFDESCGLMYSNDMWEFHPENPKYWGQWPLQFWDNGRITIERVTKKEQPMLTTWYTEHAIDFIRRHKDEPFFLYVPQSMPHVPLFCSEKFKGKSGAGLYGDVMMEIDWSVGQILGALRENGVEDNTLVIFTSDNGPWISYGNHAGKTPFREAKATSFDGGVRSACIMKYPGRIKAGTSSERAFCTIDILPTVAHLAGAELPGNPVDGRNVWDLIVGRKEAKNPHEYYPFSTGSTFEGVISGDGRWKLHVPHAYRTLVEPGKDGLPGRYRQEKIGLSLFDMENDPYETTNVLDQHPEVAERLKALADRHREEFYRR
jgi:arylsulfatase A